MRIRLLVICVVVIGWGIFITLYNSRIVGILLTYVINKLHRGPHIKFGKSLVHQQIPCFVLYCVYDQHIRYVKRMHKL